MAEKSENHCYVVQTAVQQPNTFHLQRYETEKSIRDAGVIGILFVNY